jgi:hypothetical protein
MKPPAGPKNPFDHFMESYARELATTPDEELLEGLDPAEVRKRGLDILEKAKAKAGQIRLASARAQLDAATAKNSRASTPITPAEARAFLRHAANDSRFTLAARELGELSDEDVVKLYQRLKELGAEDPGSPTSNK